jgi:glutamine synthetase
MPGNLTFDELAAAVTDGHIDTVIACMTDMQGRLMGKRFHAQHFVDSAWRETHFCDYLLATDMEMHTVPGYRATSWEAGYGDHIIRPDLTTLRRIPWLEGTALVLCDVYDHHTHEEVAHSPRAVLKRQVARLEALGYRANVATELEYFLFRQSYEDLRANGYRELIPISGYNEDYHILQTTKEEGLVRAIRNGLYGAGIPVENSKGEAETGQGEINVRYSDPIDTADNHSITKNGCKEIAWAHGRALTFMAKWHHDKVGSSSHVHLSLADPTGAPVSYDPAAEHGMSALLRSFVAGLLAHTAEITTFLAPTINSYKRFRSGTFAPTSTVWSVDSRSAGYRLCGEGTPNVRIECRIGGADLNPYLALAGLLAAGIAGIEGGLELGAPHDGDGYRTDAAPLPRSLRDAAEALDASQMLRAAMGDDVVDHYVHAARWEVSEHERIVSDWEVQRGFERS